MGDPGVVDQNVHRGQGGDGAHDGLAVGYVAPHGHRAGLGGNLPRGLLVL